MKDSEFLSWIWQRMVNVHGEQSNVDYMLRLNGIILAMKGSEAESVISSEQPKPRTKTEFVKCEFKHAWEALKAFEDGEELFRDKNQTLNTDTVEFVKAANVGGIGYILTFYKADNLYRKVETEIDERQEFCAAYHKLREEFNSQHEVDSFYNFLFDSGKFKLVE
ncbi:hypothetical protein VPHF89G1_0018 [Vibrio phage F89 g1]